MPKKLNRSICFVCGETGPNLHKVPKDENWMKKWMQNLGSNELLELGYKYLQSNARICHRHFSDWSFTTTKKDRLIRFAMPLTNEPPCGLLSLPPRQQQDRNEIEIRSDRNEAQEAILSNDQGPQPVPSTSASQRTPKTQIILNQRSKISKLKKKIEKLKTEKLKLFSLKQTLKEKLKADQYEFVLSQIRQYGRGKNGRRWSKKDKAFALNIYLQSPSAYRILRNKLCFPSRTTLKRYTFNVAQGPGFCPNLIKCLDIMSKNMTETERLCVLAWDEIYVKEGLSYCPRTDTVEGFECSEATGERRQRASYALVFMARGITKNWKQVLGYIFTAKSTKVKLTELVKQAIFILRSCNFNVIATVCDQGGNNQGIYRDLGVSPEAPFFMVDDGKIFALYDPPHLLKSVRNNFQNHGISFKEPKVGNDMPRQMYASWRHVVKLYEADSTKVYRSCPKLTKKHIVVPGLSKLSVKLAAQVLSHSVAAALCLYSSAALLGSEVNDTAEFIGRMNTLFDSVNSKALFSEKPYVGAVTEDSGHLEFWKATATWIKSWKIKNQTNQKIIEPACKKGWIMTLCAMEGIWKSIKDYQVKFLLVNRFNQDCLENTFSSVRRRGGFRDTPDCYQFRSAIHGVIIHNFLKISPTSNCIEDTDFVLVDFNKFNKSELEYLLEDGTSEECLTATQLDSVVDDSFFDNPLVIDKEEANSDQRVCDHVPLDFIEENVLAYIAGYLSKRFMEKVLFCRQCEELLVGEKILDSSAFLAYFKEYKDSQYGLRWPTNQFLNYIKKLSDSLLPKLDNAIYEKNVCKNLIDSLSIVNLDFYTNHEEHKTTAQKYFLNTFVFMMVKHKVHNINLTFRNNKANLRSQTKKKNHVYSSNN